MTKAQKKRMLKEIFAENALQTDRDMLNQFEEIKNEEDISES